MRRFAIQAELFYEYGRCMDRKRMLEDARDSYQRALELEEQFVKARIRLANVLQQMGDNDSALEVSM